MRSVLITVLAVVMIAFVHQSTDGQITGREPACGCYCPYPDYESFNITPCTGRLRDDACEDNMKQMPPYQRRSICQRMQAKLRSKPDTYPCKKLFNQICPPPCDDISCYCGYSPDGGCTFAQNDSGGSVRVYESPSTGSATLASLPNGSRVCYKMVMKVDGQEWFQVKPPGKPGGWVSSRDLKCHRPGEPPPILNYPGPGNPNEARPTAAQVAGGRG